MTPITREQAREFAERFRLHDASRDMSADSFLDIFTDFAEQVRQQVIADLAQRSDAMLQIVGAYLFQDDPDERAMCYASEVRESIASLQAKIDRIEEERDTAATDRFDEMADLRAELEQSEARVRELERDAARLNHLQDRGATVEILLGRPWRFRVGGLIGSASTSVRSAIDAAMNKESGL